MPKAATNIKFNGKHIAAGESLDKKEFTKEQWAELVAAGAVEGEEPSAPAEESKSEEEPKPASAASAPRTGGQSGN